MAKPGAENLKNAARPEDDADPAQDQVQQESEVEDQGQNRVRLRCSPALAGEIERVLERNQAQSSADEAALRNALEKRALTSDQLKALLRAREAAAKSEQGGPSTKVFSLLRAEKGKGGVMLPEPPRPKPNPELEKRRAWLIARQQRREYEASVSNIRHKRPSEKVREGMSDLRRAMKEVSVGIMMILMCVAVFLALKMAADSRGLPPHVGLQWGLFGGSFMLFVEMILFAIRTTREETQARKERAFMERQVTNISQLPVVPNRQKQPRKPKSS